MRAKRRGLIAIKMPPRSFWNRRKFVFPAIKKKKIYNLYHIRGQKRNKAFSSFVLDPKPAVFLFLLTKGQTISNSSNQDSTSCLSRVCTTNLSSRTKLHQYYPAPYSGLTFNYLYTSFDRVFQDDLNHWICIYILWSSAKCNAASRFNLACPILPCGRFPLPIPRTVFCS